MIALPITPSDWVVTLAAVATPGWPDTVRVAIRLSGFPQATTISLPFTNVSAILQWNPGSAPYLNKVGEARRRETDEVEWKSAA